MIMKEMLVIRKNWIIQDMIISIKTQEIMKIIKILMKEMIHSKKTSRIK